MHVNNGNGGFRISWIDRKGNNCVQIKLNGHERVVKTALMIVKRGDRAGRRMREL